MPDLLLPLLSLQPTLSHAATGAELARTLTICLLGATSVALISRWFRLPYIVGLVLAGLAITELLPLRIGIDSGLILNFFLPILLFQAAINTDIRRLRSSWLPVGLLAGPGVLMATAVTAVLLQWGLGLGWIPSLLLGTILAITDTVSVIAVFRQISVPSRLITIVEGESLFNDGVALVLFSLILSLQQGRQLDGLAAVQSLVTVILGGALVGVGIGYLASALFRILKEDDLSATLLTVAIAFGTYQFGELLHVSGVVGVVIAGLTVGHLLQEGEIPPTGRLTLFTFWEYAAFCVNTFIFLLIGVEVDPRTLWTILPAVLLAIAAYQLGRLLSVYPLMTLASCLERPVPWPWRHVLFLGNIKGSLSMVLALSIPVGMANRSQIVVIVFGVVLLSLVGQGLSLPWVVKRLPLGSGSGKSREVEELQARLIAGKAVQTELASLYENGVLPKALYEEERARAQVGIVQAEQALRQRYNQFMAASRGTPDSLRPRATLERRLLLVEKTALTDAVRKGILTADSVAERMQAIDAMLLAAADD